MKGKIMEENQIQNVSVKLNLKGGLYGILAR